MSIALNPFQDRAVHHDGHCTILACPGSGKTRVLTERAIRILNQNQQGMLCAVTFTRDAADELKERIAHSSSNLSHRLIVGTFHSVALSQLKNYYRSKLPKLLSDGQRIAVLKRCWKQHAPELNFDEDVLPEVDAAKATLKIYEFENPLVKVVFDSFISVMKSENSMDFSDILIMTVNLLRNGNISPLQIKWLLVDEGQDMDEVQQEWISIHGLSNIEVTLVGDDDQSLYAFRNALGYAGLQEITFRLNATESTLPINYRCAPNILFHAAKLISKNTNRAPKQIQAFKQNKGSIEVVPAGNRADEINQIICAIVKGELKQQWAILARTNAILNDVEESIAEQGFKYIRSGGKSIWEQSLGSMFTSLLKSIADGNWSGVANTLSFCGLNPSSINQTSITHNTKSLDEKLATLSTLIPEDDEFSKKTIMRLRAGLSSWAQQIKKDRATLVIHGVNSFLSEFCKPKQAVSIKKMANTLSLLEGSLSQRLNFIKQQSTKSDDLLSPTLIHLLTMHSCKGLEFDNVWIMGLEDPNMPHVDSTEEDERRLLYVGMTRAKERLVMSGALDKGHLSRFIDEAGLGDMLI